MPDTSYFPEGYEHFITIPMGTDVSEFLKANFEVATCQRAADEAKVQYDSVRTMEGQVFAFRSAADKELVEQQMRQDPDYTTDHRHVESFPVGENPLYVRAWQEVVTEAMEGRGHAISKMTEITGQTLPTQVIVEFPNDETKQVFDNLERDGSFEEFAISRHRQLERAAEKTALDDVNLGLDSKITA